MQKTSEMLAEFGAKIITIEYLSPLGGEEKTKKSNKLEFNLKNKKISAFVLQKIVPRVHVVTESFRPGVMERFGLGPEAMHAINPGLVYVRVSGYGQYVGQSGLTGAAGRDLNYLAAAGVLNKFRRDEKGSVPAFPGNILTYYGGGSIYALTLILQALLQKQENTVVTCPLTQNVAYLAQLELLDPHYNRPTDTPGRKPHNYTKPQHSVYKLLDGRFFVFRPGGILYQELEKAHFGNDDIDEAGTFQETIQLACSDMAASDIEAKYGPIEILQDLQSATANPATFSQRLTNKPGK